MSFRSLFKFFDKLSPRVLAWSAALGLVALALQAGIVAAVLLTERNDVPLRTSLRDVILRIEGTITLRRSWSDVAAFLPGTSAQWFAFVIMPFGVCILAVAATRMFERYQNKRDAQEPKVLPDVTPPDRLKKEAL